MLRVFIKGEGAVQKTSHALLLQFIRKAVICGSCAVRHRRDTQAEGHGPECALARAAP